MNEIRRRILQQAVLASGAAARTRPEDLGELTLSMLRGEQGNQARELEDLIRWLRLEKPQVVCLSNALLAGMARRIQFCFSIGLIVIFLFEFVGLFQPFYQLPGHN